MTDYYVDTDTGDNADTGLTWALAKANLSNAMALAVAAAGNHDIYVTGATADTVTVSINTTVTATSITVHMDGTGGSDQHDGTWGTGVYRLSVSANYTPAINFNDTSNAVSLEIIGMQIENSGTVQAHGIDHLRGDLILRNCIIKGANTTDADCFGVYTIPQVAVSIIIVNNLIYDWYTGVKYADNTASTFVLYNNTIVHSYSYSGDFTNWDGGGNGYIKNNIFEQRTTHTNDDYVSAGSWTLATANNITADATSPDGASYQSIQATFEDEGNDDFRLASSDTSAKDNGANLYADAQYAVTVDYIDNTRPNSTDMDIGCNEYTAAGGSIIPQATHHYRANSR